MLEETIMKNLMIAFVFLCTLGTMNSVLAQDTTKREITNVAGDLYRFQNNFHVSVFLVTEEGVLVTDPINAEAAIWLRDEIKSRFNKPIKYLVYSHHHADHVSGGEVFKQAGATVIAHENALWALESDSVPTAMPDLTFKNNMILHLGGRTVELHYLGRNHSDNSIVALFPDEQALFAVDFVNVRRLPYQNIGRSFFPDYFDSYERLTALEFTTVIPGHGPVGSRQEALDHGQYLRELHDQVKAGKAAGRSVDELKASIKMENYKSWSQYDAWLGLNIEGMYGYVE
jgi:glyoxylase-like metal-dependent hydrolase (beta-lactamase superfamily II)